MSTDDATEVNESSSINIRLLTLAHEIRKVEHDLTLARRRRRVKNVAIIFGPILGLLLYTFGWITWVGPEVHTAIYIPGVPLVLICAVVWLWLRSHPGGPVVQREDGRRTRFSEGELELELARKRDTRKFILASNDVPTKVRRIEYKEDAYADIDQLRSESNRYRRGNNILQGIVIIGSLAATGASGIAAQLLPLRWVTLGVTFTVGIASGFMGYFKYKERSFYLQQTADAIEQEWEAVQVGVGRYKNITGEDREDKALAEFVEEVHRLKSEQKKRQQNLEQPADSRNSNE